MNSQNMTDSIYNHQNDEFFLQCQVAQSREYTKAKSLTQCKGILTFTFAIFSAVASVVDNDWLWLPALVSFLAVALTLFNKHSDERIKAIKKHAASLQQYIDVALFAPAIGNSFSAWGNVPTKSDLAESVSIYTNEDVSAFVNWYSDYSYLNHEEQVFYCQKENVRWNYTLHKSYEKLLKYLLIVFLVAAVIIFLATDISFIKLFFILSWCIPIAEYCWSVKKELNASIAILCDTELYSQELENKLKTSTPGVLKDELINLQYKIWNCRENGYLISDWFYNLYKENYQKKEDNMAKTMQSIDK